MKKSSLLILSLAFLFLSCDQDEPEPSKLTLLTKNDVRSWRIVELTIDGEVTSNDCRRDDIWSLNLFDESSRGRQSVEIDENFIACTEIYRTKGLWRLNNEGTRITLTLPINAEASVDDGFNINAVYDIVELTNERLILRNFEEDEFGFRIRTYQYTFSAI